MKVADLIEKLNEYSPSAEVCFGVHNVRSGKWYDIELDVEDIGFEYSQFFSEKGLEYPNYEKQDVVYVRFGEIGDKVYG